VKIIDISRELLSAPVYPGDPSPEVRPISGIALGDGCNTSALNFCAHNATHLDAPLHYIPDGKDIASVSLDACVGECSVVEFNGILLGAQAEKIISGLHPRILFKGNMEISPSAAFVLSEAGLYLVGVEAQSVASAECSGSVHRQLLGSDMVLLEGLDLSRVQPGSYFLFAAPINIAGCDGSPVRALLIER
jgi:arylformamidase